MKKDGIENTPRIYVASLADYNCGLLGKWIDATQGCDAIHDEIKELLYHSTAHNAEEWAIHDYENFGGVTFSEFEAIEIVAELALLITEHGTIFGQIVEHFGGTGSLDEAKRCAAEGYQGAHTSLEAYVYDFVEECYGDVMKDLPEFLRNHIDYDGMARDMEMGGDIFTIEWEGSVHVFTSNY